MVVSDMASRQLFLGVFIGILIGITIFFGFTQLTAFSTNMATKDKQISDLQTQLATLQNQVIQLQYENSQMEANITVLRNELGYGNLTTSRIKKAIQIQSVTTSHVYVQNVGDLEVSFSTPCIYVDGVSVGTILGSSILAAGSTIDLGLFNPIGTGTHTVKVVTTDGVFSQATQTFP